MTNRMRCGVNGAARVTLIVVAVIAAASGRVVVAQAHAPVLCVDPDGPTAAVRRAIFTPDGKRLISVGDDKIIRLWDVDSGRPIRSFQGLVGPGKTGQLFAAAIHPDGDLLAVGGYDVPGKGDAIRLLSLTTGRLVGRLDGHKSTITTLAFSRDGATLASGSEEGTVRLWDAQAGKERRALNAGGSVYSIAFSPDGRRIAGAADGKLVRIWNVASGREERTLEVGTVFSVAWSPEGDVLASGTTDGRIYLWDPDTGAQIRHAPLRQEDSATSLLAFSRDGRRLLSGSGNTPEEKAVRVWSLSKGSDEQPRLFTGHQAPVLSVTSSPDGKLAASADAAGVILLWDPATGQERRRLVGRGTSVFSVAWSPDGKRVAWGDQPGSDNATLRFTYDLARGGLSSISPNEHAAVWQRGPARWNGRRLEIGRRSVVIRDAENGDREAGRIEDARWENDEWVICAAWTARGEVIVATSLTLALYDAASGRRLREFVGHVAPINALAVSKQGLLASASTDQTVRIWTLGAKAGATAAPLLTLFMDRDGEWIASTSEGPFDCSVNADRFIKWNVDGILYPAERYLRRFRRPDLVRAALAGEAIRVAKISSDLPPSVRFDHLKDGDLVSGDVMDVVLEVRDDQDIKSAGEDASGQVRLLVNGRPMTSSEPRPIEISAKPIVLSAKDLMLDPTRRVARQFTCHVSLPQGEESIRLRATVYDSEMLGSDPVEVVLRRTAVHPVTGNLYVLSIGVSRYKNADGKGFKDLRYPAADARAISERFGREGKPLYDQVQVHLLPDEEATVANVRAALDWLKRSVRPGQNDTVVVYLSGHGISLPDGSYYYATHELDLKRITETSLSGHSLRAALGELRAGAVFLFVDTCYAGALHGRNDDLALEVGDGAYMLASSGATERSYESPDWGHGAFTKALLEALDSTAPGDKDTIRFNWLTFVVPNRIAQLMKEAGRSESEQQPRILERVRNLREPVAQPRR